MTAEENNSAENPAEEITGRWFDMDPGEPASEESIPGRLDGQQKRHAADLQLVHSLLLQLSQNDEEKQRRLDKLMSSVRSESQKAIRMHNISRPLLRWSVAAMIIFALTVFITSLPSSKATAAIDQMIAAIDHAKDRSYIIKVKPDRKNNRRPQPDGNLQRKKMPGERAGFDGAKLYLRGNNQFVLIRQTSSGKIVVNGCDGQSRWLIRPNKPVLVSNNPEAFRIPLPSELAAMLTLDLKETLLHIRDNYKVKYLQELSKDRQQDDAITYLDARKVSHRFPGPRNIEIWSESDTGLLLGIEFADIHLQGDPSLKRLIIELDDQSQLPDDWFTHQAHHPQDAEVDFITEQ